MRQRPARLVYLTCSIVFVLCLAAAPRANGQSGWNRVAEHADGVVVFYAKPARPAGRGHVKIEVLYDYREAQQDPDTLLSHQSAIVAVMIDCTKRALRMGDMRKFAKNMGRGAEVERTHGSDARYREAKLDTIDDALVRFACKASR